MISHEMIEDHYKTHRNKYIKWLTNRSGSLYNAEDIHQEAYLRALRYKDSCREGEMGHWIGRIIHRCLIDFMNEENGRQTEELTEEVGGTMDCPSYPKQTLNEIYELIDTKSSVQIEVLTMHFRNEYSAVDIAKITEYSYAQCHKIISRFREEVRQLYGTSITA